MTVKIRESFKLRLILWVIGVSSLLFSLVLAAVIFFAGNEVRRGVRELANARLDQIVSSVNHFIEKTELSAGNLSTLSEVTLAEAGSEGAYTLCQYFLEDTPNVQGVAIAYPKGSVPGHEGGYCPYVMRTDTGYTKQDLFLVKDYFQYDWYKIPCTTRKPYWTRPFHETNGSVICSYCLPVFDQRDSLSCVLIVDINLGMVSDALQTIRPYPHSCITVVDDQGTFVAHPNHEFILNESVQSLSEKAQTAPDLQAMAEIRLGQRGRGVFKIDGKKHYLYHAPIPHLGWTATLEVPHEDVGKNMDRLFLLMISLMVLGILTLGTVCLIIINRLARPLEKFAVAARKISHGDFNIELPVVRQRNELYDLRCALAAMKSSLDRYITQLTESSKNTARIEGELNIARRIQLAMVPRNTPYFPSRTEIDICGTLIPAKAVGGDLYDYILIDDKFIFCIGDVSGKGVPASLFMAITRSLFRNIVKHTTSPANIAQALNEAISENNEENMFVTMFIGCMDFSTGKFTVCNCGHNPPVTTGQIVDPTTMQVVLTDHPHMMQGVPANIPVGVFPDFKYQEITMHVEPGVKLLLYTDGVTEAENLNHELFGDDRLLQSLESMSANVDSKALTKKLLNDLHQFTEGAEQSDDITMLCFVYKEKDNK